MAKEKMNLYLLAIVAIVAVVGIVVLVLNVGTSSLSYSSDDLSGQAIKVGTTRIVTTPTLSSGISTTSGESAAQYCCKYASDRLTCLEWSPSPC